MPAAKVLMIGRAETKAVTVTSPVAPDTLIPDPAITDVTPALVKVTDPDEPPPDMPEPAFTAVTVESVPVVGSVSAVLAVVVRDKVFAPTVVKAPPSVTDTPPILATVVVIDVVPVPETSPDKVIDCTP